MTSSVITIRSLPRNPIIPLTILAGLLLAAWVGLHIEKQALLVCLLAYSILFATISWHRPDIALMLMFSIAPFQQDLGRGGLRFSLTEVHIGLLLPILLLRNHMRHRPIRFGPTLIPVLLYFAICIYASIYSFLGRSTIISIAQMAIYLLVVVAIFTSYPDNVEQFRPALYGLIVVCCGIATYSLATHNNFFLGLGKNGVGQSLSCAVLVCVELWFAAKNPRVKSWLAVALCILAMGLVFSVSRGAWLGCFMGLMLIFGLRRQFQLMFRTGLVLLPLIALAWQFLPQDTKEYATSFDSKRFNIAERYKFIDTAHDLWAKSPIFGSGVGLRKEYDATNLAWSTLAETGVLGLLAMILIHVVFFVTVIKTHRHLARDSLHSSILLIGGALLLRHMTHGMVDHYWSRGAVTLAWAGVGMVGYSYFTVQYELRRRRMQTSQQTSSLLHNHALPLNRQQHGFALQPLYASANGTNGFANGGGSRPANGQVVNGHAVNGYSSSNGFTTGLTRAGYRGARLPRFHRARVSRVPSARRR